MVQFEFRGRVCDFLKIIIWFYLAQIIHARSSSGHVCLASYRKCPSHSVRDGVLFPIGVKPWISEFSVKWNISIWEFAGATVPPIPGVLIYLCCFCERWAIPLLMTRGFRGEGNLFADNKRTAQRSGDPWKARSLRGLGAAAPGQVSCYRSGSLEALTPCQPSRWDDEKSETILFPLELRQNHHVATQHLILMNQHFTIAKLSPFLTSSFYLTELYSIAFLLL